MRYVPTQNTCHENGTVGQFPLCKRYCPAFRTRPYCPFEAGAMTPVQETACAPPHPLLALQQARRHLLEHGHCPTAWWMSAWPVPGGAAWLQAWPLPDAQRPICSAPASCAGHGLQPQPAHAFAPHHGIPVRPGAPQPQRGGAGRPAGGMLMHTLGSPGFVDKAERVALTCGARGTNPTGAPTPSARRWPKATAVEAHGGEHFLERNSFLTCAASPIPLGHGRAAGHPRHLGRPPQRPRPHAGPGQHCARMIENRLLVATCKRNVRLHLHREPEGIGSVAEGIVAVSADGWIVGANRVALTQLGLHMGDVGATRWPRCWTCGWMTCSRTTTPPQQPQALRAARRALLYAQVQLDAAAWPAARVVRGMQVPCRERMSRRRRPGLAGHGRRPLAPPPTRPAAWWASPLRCSSRANRAWARKCLRAPCTPAAHAAPGPLWPSTARPSPSTSSNPELFGHVAGAFTGARKGQPGPPARGPRRHAVPR